MCSNRECSRLITGSGVRGSVIQEMMGQKIVMEGPQSASQMIVLVVDIVVMHAQMLLEVQCLIRGCILMVIL